MPIPRAMTEKVAVSRLRAGDVLVTGATVVRCDFDDVARRYILHFMDDRGELRTSAGWLPEFEFEVE